MIDPAPEAVEAFIARWENSGAAERANYQMFLAELCDLLGVPRPDPTGPDPEGNRYVFDRAITRVYPDGSAVTNYIDFYKAAHFVWETKQGVGPNEKACSGGLRPSAANEKAPPHDSNGIDGHRPPLQALSFEEELLTRLVALNHARAAEEKSGHIRWLRPEYQAPATTPQPEQKQIDLGEVTSQPTIENRKSSIANPLDWPAKLPEQVSLIRHLLTAHLGTTPEQLSSHFGRKNAKRTEQIDGIVETLRGLGKA